MATPKRKNNINIYKNKILRERREELSREITKSDPYLPDAILHDDLDRGMLEFIKETISITSDGEKIPVIPKLLTIQRWAQVTSTWEFSDDDGNIKIPFIALIRNPVVKAGTIKELSNMIPDRKAFTYSIVKTWDGVKQGADIYKIPQPVPIDLLYELSIVSTKMRDLNLLNKIIMQKFASKLAYKNIKGHYIPITIENIEDSSNITSLDERRFYRQSYNFKMMGYLIDPEEFEIKPAIDRIFLLNEFTTGQNYQKKYINKSIDITVATFNGNDTQTQFSVGESITILFNVMINGLIQKKDEDYYHIARTSNINFRTPPSDGDIITISYYKGRNNIFIDNYGKPINLTQESYVYDGSTLVFNTTNVISGVISLDSNGLVEEESVTYDVTGDKEITLKYTPVIGTRITISYLY